MGECGAPEDVNSNVLVARSTGDAQLDKAVWQWLSWDKNEKTKEQIESLLQDGKHQELRDRLCCRLTFGTAGLRSAMGAGFCYINDLTVIQSTQVSRAGLWESLCPGEQGGSASCREPRARTLPLPSSCVPASEARLAKLTAAVLLAKDVLVYFFSTYVPTPFVPYTVQQLGAVAGVMITASHNRKEDNGYKVRPWQPLCGVPGLCLACRGTAEWAGKGLPAHPVRLPAVAGTPPASPGCSEPPGILLKFCFLLRELNVQTSLKFVHTSFHGVGHEYVQLAFKAFGFQPPIPVPEQKDPDPDFSTVKCPNPEEGESVLELSLRLAEKEDAKVVVATDPDADRLAVAEQQENGCWKVFTGNELAALFGWWMFSRWKENCSQDADVRNVYMLATTVSSKILRAIALKEGFHFE
ncbi:PGM2L synthase, partial [Sylvietta virens]|nr:PGM2L synthase [Sylvietta virens]